MNRKLEYIPWHQNNNRKPEIIHWQYFLSLEEDFNKCLRFVEMDKANEHIYSIEFLRLLLSTCIEIETILKLMYGKKISFAKCKDIFKQNHLGFSNIEVTIPRYNIRLNPWQEWSNSINPSWWETHKDVKHDRTLHYDNANLKNTRDALGGLFCLLRAYYLASFSKLKPNSILFDYDGRTKYIVAEGDDTVLGFK